MSAGVLLVGAGAVIAPQLESSETGSNPRDRSVLCQTSMTLHEDIIMRQQ